VAHLYSLNDEAGDTRHMIPKPLDQISEADLLGLISNAVREGRTIEYKRDLPGTSDADKKEFLSDVSSFANTSGGDLIFGVEEDLGNPTRIAGLVMADAQLELARWESVIASGLDPRIRYFLRLIPCGSTPPVLVIRIEKSWIGPHRVTFKGHDKFYGRNATGKYPFDVAELRTAFTLASGVTEKIRAFRIDRVIELSNNTTPVPFVDGPKVILHFLPVEAFASQPQFDVLQFVDRQLEFPPMAALGWNNRINLNGVIAYTASSGESLVRSYVQLYRNGILEAVNGKILEQEYKTKRVIPSVSYERYLLRYFPTCIQILRTIGVLPPIVVAMTLTNVRGLQMAASEFEFGDPIAEDTLILPEIWIEDFARPPGKILKPMLDLVWNASGFPQSRNFDDGGNWIAQA
jgi:schlafen family protein